MEIKTFECRICKRFFQEGIKGEKRVIGTREYVRKHLVDKHHIKGRKNITGMKRKDFGQSEITFNTIEV